MDGEHTFLAKTSSFSLSGANTSATTKQADLIVFILYGPFCLASYMHLC
jgi:hypothetical protein